jgi:hypothetical protein
LAQLLEGMLNFDAEHQLSMEWKCQMFIVDDREGYTSITDVDRG